MCVESVAHRVRSGGHSIPSETIHRRYYAGLQNFFHLYLPLSDRWRFYDTSDAHRLIAGFQPKLSIIDEAIREGACGALTIHHRLGQDVITWRDGKIAVVPAAEVLAEINALNQHKTT